MPYPPIENVLKYGRITTLGCSAVGNTKSNTPTIMKGATITAILFCKKDVTPMAKTKKEK